MIFHNRFTPYMLLSLMLGLLVSPQQILAETAYQVVEQELLKTLAPAQEQSKRADVAALENKNQPTTFDPIKLGEYDQYAIALNLLTHHVDQSATSVIDTKFIKKMELLCGGGAPEQHLLGTLDMTQSLFGQLALAKMFVSPTRSAERIMERQAFLKGILSANTEELDALFGSLRPLEADILSYWQEENAAAKAILERLYFGSYLNFLNQSTLGLECKTRVRNLGTLILTTWPILPGLTYTAYTKGKQTRPTDIANVVKDFGLSYYPFPMAYEGKSHEEISRLIVRGENGKTLGDTFKGMEAQIKAEIKRQHDKELTPEELQSISKPVKVIWAGGKAGVMAFYLWLLNKTVNNAQLDTTTTNYLHARLINLSSYLDTIKKAHTRLSQVEGAQNIPAFDTLAAYFNGTAPISPKAKHLFSMLDSSTFKGNPSFFTLTGRVLAAHKLMEEVKDELAPFFDAAGELEAYYSVAKLYAEHQDTKAHYCFVEFAGSDKPYIEAEGFWNPFIDANKVVTNNITLNNYATHHNVILTGPNTGGKSTIIKAVAINLLLAQTFGIAAADYMKLTPFAIINCYLNITDDISTGTSLFHAEIKRAKELVDQVKKLRSDEFCFTILDEVFSGTNAEGGSESAYKFAHELGTSKNTILVIATHFANMIELEETSNFKNMSVTASVMENGKLNRPFKLENGPFHDPENTILKALLEQEGIFA